MYFTLNGNYIPNHGYVIINDIGFDDDTALICNTNRIANFHSGGDWHAPDGTMVGDLGSGDVPGFDRNRGPMVVRLHRNTATDPPSEGIYYCVVEDDTFTDQTVYVGLYNSGGGIVQNTILITDWEKVFCYTLPTLLIPLYVNYMCNSGDITISGGMTFTVNSELYT